MKVTKCGWESSWHRHPKNKNRQIRNHFDDEGRIDWYMDLGGPTCGRYAINSFMVDKDNPQETKLALVIVRIRSKEAAFRAMVDALNHDGYKLNNNVWLGD